MSFDPYNCPLKIWDSNSQSESSLGSVKVHSLTLSHIPGSIKCDSRASLLACTFASPCLSREPKAKVVTHTNFFLPSQQLWWHSSTKCNHSFGVYFSTKTTLFILTFLTIMLSSSSTNCNDTMKSFSVFLVNNNCKDCEAFQKYHIH